MVERADAASPVAREQSAAAVSPVARERLRLLAAVGDAAMKRGGATAGGATSRGRRRCHEVGTAVGAAMETGWSFNGASPEPSELQWSSARVSTELCRSRRSCIGASLVLLWSSAGVAMELRWSVGASLELRWCCYGARPELQWSFAGVLVLRWSSVGFQWSSPDAVRAAPEFRMGLQWCYVESSLLSAMKARCCLL